MRFGSICSGIEAASVAFGPLGWIAAWFSEIEDFPRKVLAHHYPKVPNLGDMRLLPLLIRMGLVEAPDALVGGTPCQAFSVAGLRKSLGDARGNLSLTFCEIADAIDDRRTDSPPCVIKWENVPGVLSTPDNAFGCFLAGLAGDDGPLEPPEPRPAAGRSSRHWRWDKSTGTHVPRWSDAGAVYGPRRTVAWRTFDAQYSGLAQRRRRVFVVASARTDFDPVAVLFEFDGVRRDTAPSRGTPEDLAPTIAGGARRSGGYSSDDIPATVATLDANFGRLQGASGQDARHGHSHLIAGTLTSHAKGDGVGQESKLVAFGGNNCSGPIAAAAALNAKGGSGRMDFETETLITHALTGEGFDASEDGTGRGTPLVACLPFDTTQITSATNRSNPQPGDPCHPLSAGAHPPAIAFDSRQDPVSSTDLFGALGSSSPQAQAVAFQSSQSGVRTADVHATLDSNNGSRRHNGALVGMQVRRLIPLECERLQGFPDNYTRIPIQFYKTKRVTRLRPADMWEQVEGGWMLMAADGPRYKALGNSWPVPVVRWIGRRIQRQLA